MNSLSIHVPTFVETSNHSSYTFETQDELLALDCLKSYFSKGMHLELSGNQLLAVSEDKLYWWVVGNLRHTQNVDLPAWKSYFRVKFEDGRIEIRDDVILSSGDWVEFRNGVRAINIGR